MTITAVLVWYDEPVPALQACVSSLAPLCDNLYAVDGAWRHYPHRQPMSPADQHLAIMDAARAASITALIPLVEDTWPSQVDKRAWAYSNAIEVFEPDWLFVIDADETLTYIDRQATNCSLEATTYDVANITCDRYRGGSLSKQRPIRRLFRGIPGLTVTETHNHIVTPDGRHLGGDRSLHREPALDLTAHVVLRHDAWSRGQARNTASKHYYAAVHRAEGRH